MKLDWPKIRWFKRSDPITFGGVSNLVGENATLRSRVEALLAANNRLVADVRAARRDAEWVRENLHSLIRSEWETRCLSIDPFEGDFGNTDYKILKDEIVRAGKYHSQVSHCCGGDIPNGQRHRVRAEKIDGEFMSFRWCYDCCQAMALSAFDDGKAWEARIGLYV